MFFTSSVHTSRVQNGTLKSVGFSSFSPPSPICPAATAPATSLMFPKTKITAPRAAAQNVSPKVVPIFRATDAKVNQAKVPSILTHENHIENAPSFPGGEHSSNRTRPNAWRTPADVPCSAAKISTRGLFQLSFRR
ncbi:hypothetical protein SLA2020_313500 [Shorea laevis]